MNEGEAKYRLAKQSKISLKDILQHHGHVRMISPDSYVDADFTFAWMVGRCITEVNFHEPSLWVFSFGRDASISVECPWRIVQNGRVVLSYDDHGQQFGLPAPIDAVVEATQLFSTMSITAVQLREGTADLFIECADRRLEIIPFSSGYESWQLQDPLGSSFVAQGGGEISTWKTSASDRTNKT